MNKQSKSVIAVMIMAFCTFLTTNLLYAQPPQGSFERGTGQGFRGPMVPDSSRIVKTVDNLAKVLSLSKQQKAKITKLQFAHFEEIKKSLDANMGDREIMRQSMEESRAKLDKGIKALLTNEQKKKYDNYVKQQREQRRQRTRPSGAPGMPPEGAPPENFR